MLVSLSHEQEKTDQARGPNGQPADNPTKETVYHRYTNLNLRYGLTDRMNLSATFPFLRIFAGKTQGMYYVRNNKGLGDIVLMASYRALDSPQVALELGVRLPSGSTDNKDALGQRICDILALGSGVASPIAGIGLWRSYRGVDIAASFRYRWTLGANKWGYEWGNEAQWFISGSKPVWRGLRIGARLLETQIGHDFWYGNLVPERGARVLRFEPELTYALDNGFMLTFTLRHPVRQRYAGDQMVADYFYGLNATYDMADLLDRLAIGE